MRSSPLEKRFTQFYNSMILRHPSSLPTLADTTPTCFACSVHDGSSQEQQQQQAQAQEETQTQELQPGRQVRVKSIPLEKRTTRKQRMQAGVLRAGVLFVYSCGRLGNNSEYTLALLLRRREKGDATPAPCRCFISFAQRQSLHLCGSSTVAIAATPRILRT